MAQRREANGEAAAAAMGAAAAGTIDQVRELLFGDANRDIDRRLQQLEAKMEAQIAALQADMLARVQQLDNRLSELAAETEDRRLSTIDDIGRAISDLGANVRNLSAARKSR